MSVGLADLRKAIKTVWDASTLDTLFKALWIDSTETEFPVLNDQEAAPSTPFPYCVLEGLLGSTTDRMSGSGADEIHEIRDVPVNFKVHAREVSGDSRSADEIAAYLAEEIMKIFGGHPSVSPQDLTLDNGNFLLTQLQNDQGIRTGDDEYMWLVPYIFRIDVPVAV